MCIIAVKPSGKKMFSKETIRNMWNRNPDGAGLMYYEDGQVHCIKGFMRLEDLLYYLKQYDFTHTNLCLHFRIGTSGRKDELNCHPYPVYEENDTEFETNLAVMHNGVMYNYSPGFYSEINDTQVFINCVLSQLDEDFVKDADKKLLIEELIPNNKLCFLNSKNEITLFGNGWINNDGYFYSNASYTGMPRRVQTGLFSEFNDFELKPKISKKKASN